MPEEIATPSQRTHVLIAGGGVAALETMMALRALAGDRVSITLLTPQAEFRYRPMAVAEPFTIAHVREIAVMAIAADFDAQVRTGALASVEPEARRVLTSDGDPISYDALVIATGAPIRPAFPGAITIDDRRLGDLLRGLVQDVEEGYVKDIAFVAPAQAFWPLPLYELALLTARRAYDMNITVEISVVSPERAPLSLFGQAAVDEVSALLRDAGVAFHGSSFAEFAHGELTLRPAGTVLRPGRVVALPVLEGPQITGVPADPHGFIAVDELGRVRGIDAVYAAGDVTTYPIKHGGIAAQQADVVAASIAARTGAAVEPRPLRPVLRGELLTGDRTRFFEAELDGDRPVSSTVSDVCPWDPPSKIVARHLAPYLARADEG